MRLRTLFFFMLLLTAFLLEAQEEYAWKLVKTNNDIKAYVKKNPNSKVRTVRVETITTATLSEVVSIIKDAGNHNKWVFVNNEACILESFDKYSWVYYGISDLPWPVSDRDIITMVKLVQDTSDFTIYLKSTGVPHYLDEKEGFVRINDVVSEWRLNPIGNGTIHIAFELTLDVGGSIPLWFINLAVTKGPMQTMQGLLEMIESGDYKTHKLEYIREF